ncbi:(S)-acetoin forming diacetyl reductase [Eupransor demetentiae]|uniref:diacetyl reductase [(S)-acetoin forming] n=1 Tax=Eupransor demetentiae TaxID=3109584 RepID=A0ABP0ERH4_9LACO|nr:NAD(P)-dependent dehydrogenase [Lactobacillaceae bacterium LMG 33000]
MTKVAVVTGGNQGIGQAIVERLADDGFKVAIVARNTEKSRGVVDAINKKHPDAATALHADVSQRDEVFAAVQEAVRLFGDLTVLINNAGVAPTTPILEVDEDTLEFTQKVNVNGTVWGIQAAVKAFEELGHGGKIINATSQAGIEGNPNLTVYGSTKFAIRGITQTTAKELAEKNITVNAYAPGIVKTPMMFDIAHEVGQKAGKDDEWGMKQFAKDIAMQRLADPEEIAAGVAFLAVPDSDYMTGQTLVLDGGMVFH